MLGTIPAKRKIGLWRVLAMLLCVVWGNAHGGNYNMVRYHWEQGFNASKGYSIMQDHKGYIWIGTDRGLFRFNGYDFKRYTTQDGLPDNEILGLHEDPEGRIWMVPFAGSLCYLENGNIHNADNDPLLKRLRFDARPTAIYFDKYGNKWIFSDPGREIVRVNAQGHIEKMVIKLPDGSKPGLGARVVNKGQLEVLLDGRVYCWTGNRFEQRFILPPVFDKWAMLDSAFIYNGVKGLLVYRRPGKEQLIYLPFHNGEWFFASLNDHEMVNSTAAGAFITDVNTRKVTDSFSMPGSIRVNRFIVAKDSSLWFTTLGSGCYKITRSQVKTLQLPSPAYIPHIQARPDGMAATTDQGLYLQANEHADGQFGIETIRLREKNVYEHYKLIIQNSKGQWLCFGTQKVILKNNLGGPPLQELLINTKARLNDTGRFVWLGCIFGLHRFDVERFRTVDTFLGNVRVLSLAQQADTIYIGTLNGLLGFVPGRPVWHVLPGEPVLGNSVPAVCIGKNKEVWAANSRGELVIIRNGGIASAINFKNGLLCNRISCMKTSDKYVWVGTDNGLFAVMKAPPYKVVRHISYATGLTSSEVNCIDILNGRVWVGTAAGINYIDEDGAFYKQDTAAIFINSIRNGDKFFKPSGKTIELHKGALDIDFDVIDFAGGARPFFEYRLNNDSSWTSLSGNHLVFPAVPPGDFTVQIRAYAPNWASAVIFTQAFFNPPPFYLRPWFIAAALLALIATSILIITLLNRRMLRKKSEDLAIQQNLLLLEQMALQGQMNPHFIFNCITAIKQYYGSGNVDKAEDFTDAFALLIRQTFEMSSNIFITLDKELDYLKQYLDVEQARFDHSFQYSIRQHTITHAGNIPVPAMLLQPVLENAIRHGVRHLPDGTGFIEIDIAEIGENIRFTITDNGIGLEKSRALKARAVLRTVTSSVVNTKRIDILNRLFRDKITVRTEDISEEGRTGTKVVISYPVNIRQYIHYESNHS